MDIKFTPSITMTPDLQGKGLSKDREVLEYLEDMGLNEEGYALLKHYFRKLRSKKNSQE